MAEPRIRTLFVCNVLKDGGAERFVSNALQILDRRRFDLHLALFRDEVIYDLPDDIPVHLLQKYRRLDIPRAVWRLKTVFEKLEPDIVLTPHTGISLFAGEALRFSEHRPAWIARIAIDPCAEDRGLYGWWSRRALRQADVFLANGDALAEAFEGRYPFAAGRVRRLYNPTNFEQIDERAQAAPDLRFSGKPTIVSAGRLHPQKRFDILLEAFARLRAHRDVDLIILGEGELRQALERQVAELGLQNAVRLPGFLNNPFAVFARAHLFVLSSDFEGLPNVLIEAQGLGIPAIATDCPTGPAEIIVPDETGLLIPPGDPAALADAMGRLLDDPELLCAMGMRARKQAREKFDSAHIVQELTELLVNCVNIRKSA